MAPIDNAIADLELTEEGADFALTQITDRHGVNRSTLSKRWRGLTGSQSDGYAQQQLLNPKQEDELARYIEDLTAKLLPPTRQMIRNFSSEISCIYVGEAWGYVFCIITTICSPPNGALPWSPTATPLNHTISISYTLNSSTARCQSTMYCLITHTIWMKKAS
jgi:hypothetical protein